MAFDNTRLDTAEDWPEDPIGLFRSWFDRVTEDGVPEPEAHSCCRGLLAP